MKLSVHFGAGNIGRGFIGAVLSQSGYRVLFADVNRQVIDAINNGGGYRVCIADDQPEEFDIKNVSAIMIGDVSLTDSIAGADLVTTAVGTGIIPRIAPYLSKGIAERFARGVTATLNVIACENGIAVTTLLRNEVFKHLDRDCRAFAERYIGFADCSVDRIVPPLRSANPADVFVERFYEWNVDRSAIRGPFPGVKGMNLTDNLQAYSERKLFTLNTGHAVTAYLGCLTGYATIDRAIADKAILSTARGAMRESGLALVAKYDFVRDTHFAYIEKIIARFRNPCLHDDVRRVGREPLRKLSPGDRLVKPMTTARSYGIETPNLIKGIAAALRYDNPEDRQSVEMQRMLSSGDMAQAIASICGLKAGSHETEAIIEEYTNLK